MESLAELKRRLIVVREWFDEERTLPWSYVARTADGRFEAITTHLVSKEIGAREKSLGIFNSVAAALTALDNYRVRLREHDVENLFDFDDLLIGQKRTIH